LLPFIYLYCNIYCYLFYFTFTFSSPVHPASIHCTTTDPPDLFAPPFARGSAPPVGVAAAPAGSLHHDPAPTTNHSSPWDANTT
jgi:hypothetical protein